MAYGTLPKPGTKLGPCLNRGCNHRDCEATRQMAAQGCSLCNKEIGYDTPFYDDPLRHRDCSEDAAEQERRAASGAEGK
jgi:hypothetical protein